MKTEVLAHTQWPPPQCPPTSNLFRSIDHLASLDVATNGSIGPKHSRECSSHKEIGEGPPLKRLKLEVGAPNYHGLNTPPQCPRRNVTIDAKLLQSIILPSTPWGTIDGTTQVAKQEEVSSSGLQATIAASLPMPRRPWKHNGTSRDTLKVEKNKRIFPRDVPVPNVPYKLDNPSEAPKLAFYSTESGKNSGTQAYGSCSVLADFFPWTGNHSEDILNEQTVINGYSDKFQVASNETGNARSTLYNIVKHKSGLHLLSTFFSSALRQRQQHQKITSRTTFRPPPRVTLTEAKRKSWLNDLANKEVALRRLSRTIPQGIRGQLLLDLCLHNNIPISRAMWFAKCVGANEIRTLKRKGTSGTFNAGAEIKWLRDWTTNIEQFVERNVGLIGSPGWRRSIGYSLRIATTLYLENLLDRDHYLDWVLRSASSTQLDRLPFWLMIIHIHYKDLIRTRRKGRHLAEVVLSKMELVQSIDIEAFKPLLTKLTRLIRSFVIVRPACFLMPEKWSILRSTLRGSLDLSIGSEEQLFQELEMLNGRVTGPSSKCPPASVSPRQLIIQLLDTAKATSNFIDLANECLDACTDKDLLVSTVLEWASTQYRCQEARTYFAVRLLRCWHKHGWDLDNMILQFVDLACKSKTVCAQALHHLISELVRSRLFSVSKYLQRLTAAGALKGGSFIDGPALLVSSPNGIDKTSVLPICEDVGQLLTEVPLAHLSSHVRNLRSVMLSRAGYSPEVEAAAIHHCKCFLAKRLSNICLGPEAFNMMADYSKPKFHELPWTIRSELGLWLRDMISLRFDVESYANRRKKVHFDDSIMTVDDFAFIRDVVESMGDISILADILRITSKLHDELLLASVADTIVVHMDAFLTIGALSTIHGQVFQAYHTLRSTKTSLTTFTISLIDLAKRVPSVLIPLNTLYHDLAKGCHESATAAYSPFSDGIAESLQQAGSGFVEEFEAVLQSGINMDEQTMKRLFSLVVDRLEKERFEGELSQATYCQLLARLRVSLANTFDRLMAIWTRRVLSMPSASRLLAALISSGCVSLKAVLGSLKGLRHDSPHFQHSIKVMANLIGSTASMNEPGRNSDTYRFGVEWRHYVADDPIEATEFVCKAFKECSKFGLDSCSLLEKSLSQMLFSFATHTKGQVPKIASDTSTMLIDALDRLLPIKSGDGDGMELKDVVQAADDFNLSCCHLRLGLFAQNAERSTAHLQVADALFSLAVDGQGTEGSHSQASRKWLSFLPAAGEDVACEIREKAEQAFLALTPPLHYSKADGSASGNISDDTLHLLNIYMDVASKTSYTVPRTPGSPVCTQLNEKFTLVARALGNPNAQSSATSASTLRSFPALLQTSTLADVPAVSSYLALLLRLTCLHRTTFTHPVGTAVPKQVQQEQVRLLVLLINIALHPTLASESTVRDIFNTLATLVDSISDEIRLHCLKFLKDKIKDGRVAWLFGSVNALPPEGDHNNSNSLLQLVKKEGKGVVMGEWKIKQWELLEGGTETSLNMELFDARRGL